MEKVSEEYKIKVAAGIGELLGLLLYQGARIILGGAKRAAGALLTLSPPLLYGAVIGTPLMSYFLGKLIGSRIGPIGLKEEYRKELLKRINEEYDKALKNVEYIKEHGKDVKKLRSTRSF